MKFLDKLFKEKDQKTIIYLVTLCAAGILLISLSFAVSKQNNTSDTETAGLAPLPSAELSLEQSINYDKALEKRLQEILSHVDGAGEVEVMVTLSQSKEIVIAEDKKLDETRTTETDSAGGEREVYSSVKTEETLFMRSKDGSETPIIITEMPPKISGVLVVAQGGANAEVKDALIRAVQTVLGIEMHKVQVLKMK